MVKNYFILKAIEITSDRGLILQFFEATTEITVNYFKVNFLQYLMLVLISSSLGFCVVNMLMLNLLFNLKKLLLIVWKWSKYFLHINAKLFDALSMVIIANLR